MSLLQEARKPPALRTSREQTGLPSLLRQQLRPGALRFTVGLFNMTFNDLVDREMPRSGLETAAAEAARDTKLLYKIVAYKTYAKKLKKKKRDQRHPPC